MSKHLKLTAPKFKDPTMSSILTGTTKYVIPLTSRLEADFVAADTHIYTSTTHPRPRRESDPGSETPDPATENGYLIIISHSTPEDIDSALENARYIRPRLLMLLGVLTFLTDEPFTPLEITSSSSRKDHTREALPVSKNKLVSETGDHSKDLELLLSALNYTNPGTKLLAASLLDRWRKARWMQSAEEEHLYADESFLSYFHILELLAAQYDKELSGQIKENIEVFIYNLLEKTLKHRGSRLQQLSAERFKSVKAVVADHVPIASRICHFLEHLGMLNLKSQGLVEGLIDIRNSIAHGRQAYHDKLIWPLPSFFPLSNDSLGHLPEIRVMTARAIARHYGLSAWRREWNSLVRQLHPPDDIVRAFVKGREYAQIKDNIFLSGRAGGITPSAITTLYLTRKIKFNDLEAALRGLMIRAKPTIKNAGELMGAAYLLSDSSDPELASKAQSFVEALHNGRSKNKYVNPKDALRRFEYLGLSPVWLRSWVESRRIPLPPRV